MGKSEKAFVILVDTNAMSALSLYVESCITVKAEPGTLIEELKSKFKQAKNTKDTQLYFEGRGSIGVGYSVFDHLKCKLEEFETVQIWFSLLSEIELLDIFLERAFDLELMRKGIPYRIRRKKPFRTQIDFDYKAKVADYWENIKDKLAESDIEFEYPEKDEGAIREIVKIAKIVTRYVALEPVDLYLYASGIYLRADEIYTRDDELREIINRIYSNEEWGNIYKSIQKDLVKFVPSFRDEYQKEKKISFPKGVK
jgi:hypothetical protein